MRRVQRHLAAFLTAGLITGLTTSLITGCGNGGMQEKKEERDSTEGFVLNLQIDAEAATLDPQEAVDTTSLELIADYMEGLYENSKTGQPVMALADTVTADESQTVYTITLKEAFWSDGTRVTAQDFVFGWQRGADPKNQFENGFLMETAGIKNAEAVRKGERPVTDLGIHAEEEGTLIITLEEPIPYLTSMLALPFFYPMNQAFYESTAGSYGTSPDTVLSNGPFVLTVYTPATQELEFEKSETYRNAAEVAPDGLHYQVIKDTQTAELAYRNGQLDMALLSGAQAEAYMDSEEFLSLPLGSLWYLSPNLSVAGLENEKLRQALALSYDKEMAVSQVLHDGSKAAYGAVPSGTMFGPDGRDFREGTKRYFESDLKKARTLFEEAKQELGTDQFSFTLLIEDTETAGNLGQFLQEQIQNNLPGVTINLEPVPKKMRLQRMSEGDYELGLARWGSDYGDPLGFLDMWTTDSPYNYGGFTDPDYDALITSAKTLPLTREPGERFTVLKHAEEMVMDHAAIFPVCEKANAMLLKKDISGVEFYSIGVNRVWKHAEKTQNQ